ncbi:hypothetical protein [Candidatus Nitronereus thalassa]|uniref:Uncharacterized protein n=1 Tax=Candidatus Nitronereus thalassa TaxID=3020898 RepID=A0ABU3K8A5_9BACT|nr:hypothetical protein [Candidatus Nitronereus thalassa]MDT7042618.1 hypothetical protein [Candidatus Nitronereus thalassa]
MGHFSIESPTAGCARMILLGCLLPVGGKRMGKSKNTSNQRPAARVSL